jgi:hypothetical protein
MRINIVTFNLANTSEYLSADSTKVLQYDPDIHVEATQEDYRELNNNSIFGPSLTNAGYGLFQMTSLNDTPNSMNVVLRVYMKYKLLDIQNTAVETGKKPLPTQEGIKGNLLLKAQKAITGFSKGAIWIKVEKPMPILFINVHLPILKKKGNLGLGFNFRAQKMIEVLNSDAIKDLISDNTTVFMTGDMNFRINPNHRNQLTNLLTQIPLLKELPFINPEDKVITCKFEKGDSDECDKARQTTPEESITMNKTCMDKKRIPSRCDRILYNLAPTLSMKVLQHKGANLYSQSDHNALFATVELTEQSRSRVITRKRKSLRRQTRKQK